MRLHGTGRAPSYREIAILILKNDLLLRGLGFSGNTSPIAHDVMRSLDAQGNLF